MRAPSKKPRHESGLFHAFDRILSYTALNTSAVRAADTQHNQRQSVRLRQPPPA